MPDKVEILKGISQENFVYEAPEKIVISPPLTPLEEKVQALTDKMQVLGRENREAGRAHPVQVEDVKEPVQLKSRTIKKQENDLKSSGLSFKPLTPEEVDKLSIQQLLEVLLQGCYLIQHEGKKLSTENLQTLQTTLDLVVKKLSEAQKQSLWTLPSFIGIGAGAISPLVGSYKPLAETISGSLTTLKDIMQQVDRSKETPISAEQSQILGTTNTLRETKQTEKNEFEKTLSNLEQALNKAHDLLMRLADRN